MVRILFLGDIVGKPGRDAVAANIREIKDSESIDIVIANGENAAGGSGINRRIAEALHESGVDGITLGDHVWDQRGWENDIKELPFVCRPFNLPDACPGSTSLILESNGFRLGVITCLGTQFMKVNGDNGFSRILSAVKALSDNSDAVFVEMHAETTSEKIAMGWYLDGVATAVVGTHTHVPTGDERILPRGTGYLTDAGMCGPYDSVLGRDIQAVVARFVDGMPRKFNVASNNVQLHGVILEVEKGKRGCQSFQRWSKIISD